MARASYPDDFEIFWATYPLHVAKKKAAQAWARAALDADEQGVVLAALRAQIAHRAHTRAVGQWMPEWPHPATWLNGERWTDELPAVEGVAQQRPVSWRMAQIELGRRKLLGMKGES